MARINRNQNQYQVSPLVYPLHSDRPLIASLNPGNDLYLQKTSIPSIPYVFGPISSHASLRSHPEDFLKSEKTSMFHQNRKQSVAIKETTKNPWVLVNIPKEKNNVKLPSFNEIMEHMNMKNNSNKENSTGASELEDKGFIGVIQLNPFDMMEINNNKIAKSIMMPKQNNSNKIPNQLSEENKILIERIFEPSKKIETNFANKEPENLNKNQPKTTISFVETIRKNFTTVNNSSKKDSSVNNTMALSPKPVSDVNDTPVDKLRATS